MHKRKMHHIYVVLRPFSVGMFVVLFAISSFITVLALRSNNVQMLELRQQVYEADEKGEGVEEALSELRRYVHGHMWTDLSAGDNAIYPPVQLKNTYERLVAEERQRVAAINQRVNQEGTRRCEGQYPAGQLQARAKCVQDYVAQNSASERPVPKELYQFDFVSPVWSPDFAGLSLLLSLLLFALLVVRYFLDLWLQQSLD